MIKKRLYRFFAIFAALFFVLNVNAQITINEIQSMNGNVIADEDGDYEDWIEIVNTSTTQDINLQGYYLSDNINSPFKWKFPSYVLKKKTGAEFERVLVFASGKDRYECFDHWELLINNTDSWKYTANKTSTIAAANWYQNFNSSWPTGSGVFGYGDNNITGPSIATGTISIFLQKQFTIADTSKIDALVLSCDYDDGFVAYINGVEIARDNIGGATPAWNALAINATDAAMTNVGGKPRSFIIPKSVWKNFIKSASTSTTPNLLSIQVHNASATSSDLNITAFLSVAMKESSASYTAVPNWFPYRPKYLHTNFKIESLGESICLTPTVGFTQEVIVPNLLYNTSFGRRSSVTNFTGDGTGGFQTLYPATPKTTNNTSNIYNGNTGKPLITLPSGFYNSVQTIAITGNLGNQHIRYTTNGSVPKITDKLYSSPIFIDSTMVIKARIFSDANSQLPGPIATATYFINCPSILPVLTITIDSFDLYDYNTGIYVKGPNADALYPHKGANFWQDWERPCQIELFDTNRVRQIFSEGMIGIFGNYTRAKPQKSLDFKTQTLYDTAGITYKIFPQRNKVNFKNLVFRDAGSDWMDGHIRDEFLHRVHFEDGIFGTSARTVVSYLNGKYNGIYHIREKSDEKYLSDISGINKDSIDQIRVSGTDYAANGDMTAFNSMINYFSTHDLTNPTYYNEAKSYWNMENFMTYFAAEIYCANEDWISTWINNIKLWRPRGIAGAKWNYMIHDVDQGLRKSMTTDTTLHTSYTTYVTNNHSLMLKKFLANPEFKRRFINKFYDLFNTTLKRDSMLNVLNRFVNSFSAEIPRAVATFPLDPGMPSQNQNTFTPNTVSKFNTNIDDIKYFINNRQNVIRNQLVSEFGLSSGDTALVTVGVAPGSIGKGKVKFNSLKPTDQYWSGYYLKSNQVEAEAIAEPGYVFDYWSASNSFIADSNMVLVKYINTGDSLIANFKIAPKIAITELNYKSEPTRNAGDWIELYNNGPIAMNIGGWKLKKVSDYKSYTIPNNTFLNPGAYLVLINDTNVFSTQFQGITNKKGPTYLSFNDDGDVLLLTDNKDNVMLRIAYSDTNTWPDCANGYGRTLQIVNPDLNPNKGTSWTCGCMGGSPGWAYTASCPDPIIFNEINYNSNDTTNIGDWVELYNYSGNEVDLSNWIFKDGLDEHAFVFPQNTKISPWGYLVLVQNLAQFNSKFGQYSYINKLGSFTWGLNGNKEALRLYGSNGKISQSMYYKDNAPWPTRPNGLGWTLELIYPTLNPTSPYSWADSCKYGTPGSANFQCALSISEYDKNSTILIYPNPASDIINIQLNEATNYLPVDIEVFDLQGRRVVKETITSNKEQSISIATLQKGMYLLRISSKNEIIGTSKLLKQ